MEKAQVYKQRKLLILVLVLVSLLSAICYFGDLGVWEAMNETPTERVNRLDRIAANARGGGSPDHLSAWIVRLSLKSSQPDVRASAAEARLLYDRNDQLESTEFSVTSGLIIRSSF